MATIAPPNPPASPTPQWLENVYERLVNEDDGRVCHAISEEACRATPGNFARMLVANALSTVADSVASAKTTLPWLMLQLGAPTWLNPLLVPIREAGSMLPQLLLGALVRSFAVRKWVWVLGGAAQGACLAGMALVAWTLEGLSAGLAIVALLTLFSLARGACSIAYKDVLGKTIPKTRRGVLSGWIGSIAGALSMAVGAGLGFLTEGNAHSVFVGVLGAGAVLGVLAAWSFSQIVEFPGATEGGVNGMRESFSRLGLLRDDPGFRRFVIARALAMGSGLAAPFYVALAREALGEALSLLGAFIVMEGLAGLVSSPLWGKWADRSSRRVFAFASALSALLSMAVAAAAWVGLDQGTATVFYPLAFLGLGVAHAGVRLGRKTYLVDMSEGNRRTDYVAVSNTTIGALLLVSGAAGALASLVSVPGTLMLMSLAGLVGALLSLRLREVSGRAPLKTGH
ncbi:MAG: MFS transporter [Burkholderiaceae bacterium]